MKTRIFLVIAIISVIVSTPGFSKTIIVTTGTDSIAGSLRDAVNNAQNGDVVTFDKTLTEIKLGVQISFDKSITISGNPGLRIFIRQLDNPSFNRIFEINGSDFITVSINNLKFGQTPIVIVNLVSYTTDGAIILISNTNAIVNIDFCHFTSWGNGFSGRYQYVNSNGINGGGIAQYGGVLNISNSTFNALGIAYISVYWGNGGAIFQQSGALNLVNCTFYQNQPVSGQYTRGQGSAIYSENSMVSITNCTFCENINSHTYTNLYPNIELITHAIYLDNSDIEVKNSIFYHNESKDIAGDNSYFSSGGYNIFDQATVSGSVSSDLFNCNPGFILVVNPLCIPCGPRVVLSDNTFWIPVCAIDTAGCAVNALPANGNGSPLYDERGFTRIGSNDIGAYEYDGKALATGITDSIIESPLILFPNPVTNELLIRNISKNAKISIYDLSGRLILNKIARSTVEIIDVSSLLNGVYPIKISTNNNVTTEKFIKN